MSRDPALMTERERRRELAQLFALAYLRHIAESEEINRKSLDAIGVKSVHAHGA